MFCEKTVIAYKGYLYIAHCGVGDVNWEYRSRKERYNPLRYEIGVKTNTKNGPRFWINRNGILHTKLRNTLHRLKQSF